MGREGVGFDPGARRSDDPPSGGALQALWLNHDSANCSEHFQGEITRLGITPSFSFVEEPQTNGSSNGSTDAGGPFTGRSFARLTKCGKPCNSFRQDSNRSWRLEKLGFMTSRKARQRYEQRLRLAAT